MLLLSLCRISMFVSVKLLHLPLWDISAISYSLAVDKYYLCCAWPSG